VDGISMTVYSTPYPTGRESIPEPALRRPPVSIFLQFLFDNQKLCYILTHSPTQGRPDRPSDEEKRRDEFFYFFARNPLKSPDSAE
jgi:hypothetical protein